MKGTEESSQQGHKGREGGKGVRAWLVDEPFRDRLVVAFQREREHRRVLVPECDSAFGHVFRCVCCGRVRGEEERREARSRLCIRCVREAGFWN